MSRKPSQKLREVMTQLAEMLRTTGAGSRLPSVRSLARQSGAAPQTVRKALWALARQGHITIVNRGGAVVTGQAGPQDWHDRCS